MILIFITGFKDQTRLPKIPLSETVSIYYYTNHCLFFLNKNKIWTVFGFFFRFTRLLVFTLEVAIATMPKNTQQFVLLFDASKFFFFQYPVRSRLILNRAKSDVYSQNSKPKLLNYFFVAWSYNAINEKSRTTNISNQVEIAGKFWDNLR